MSVELYIRGNWYWAGGKNSHGIPIKIRSIQIPVGADRSKAEQKRLKALAEKKVSEMEWAIEWPPKAEPLKATPKGLSLLAAYEQWLKLKKEGSNTWKAYKSVKRFLIEPLALQGVTLVTEVSPQRLSEMQADWKDNQGQTMMTIQSWRRYSGALFGWCIRNEHLEENPWRRADRIKREDFLTLDHVMADGAAGNEPDIATLPIDVKGNANWLRIKAEIPTFFRETPRHKTKPMSDAAWLTWLELMYETGLRRSDALLFRPDLIVPTKVGGRYTRRQRKSKKYVTCFIPQWLTDKLRALPVLKWKGDPTVNGAGQYPFYNGSSSDMESYMEAHLNAPLRELGQRLGMKESLRPHRFRDSFAVNMLSMGMLLQDVSRMLGHTNIATTQKHYAPYVPTLQDAIENRQAEARQLRAAFEEAEAAAQADLRVSVN